MDSPAISIVTVFHNRGPYVRDSITSILSQTLVNFEFIIVNDGSTDNTLEEICSFSDERIKVISHDNMGFTRSIRIALALCAAPYVAIHGAGDISAPNRLRKQHSMLQMDDRVGIVGCHVENERNGSGASAIIKSEKKGRLLDVLAAENPFTHGEVMFRRDVYERAGGYRELFVLAQDRDLWLRMARLTDYDVVPEMLYIRRKFPNSISSNPYKIVQQYLFSDLAIQCSKTTDEYGKDMVDRYGVASLIIRRSSHTLAEKVAWLALRLLANGRCQEACEIAIIARRERLTRLSLIAGAATSMSYITPFIWRKAFLPLLRRRLERNPSYHW